MPVGLIESILDVLVALGFVSRDGSLFAATAGLQPLLAPPGCDYLLRDARATFLQSRALIDEARRGTLAAGWVHTDPELLQTVGAGSAGTSAVRMLSERVFPIRATASAPHRCL